MKKGDILRVGRPHKRGRSFRADVFRRDMGVCAQCGIDTTAVKAALMALVDAASGSIPDALWALEVSTRLRDSAHWEADHVVPICEGGDNTAANARTLCLPHHRMATAELAARLSRKPRKKRTA